MKGLMQDGPLTLVTLFERCERYFPTKGITTATASGLGGVLDTLGISADGRVATFGWNTARHLELYFAAPCTGRVLHTLNIRLFPDQLVYVVNHAEDEIVFVDRSLLPVFLPLADKMDTVKHIVVIDDGAPSPIPDDGRILDYEELLAAAEPYRG